MPPNNTKYPIPNESHSQKQGDPWKKYQNTPTSPPNPTKQAPISAHVPPDTQIIPNPKKCMSPDGSYGPIQGNPWQKFQPTLTPSSVQIKKDSTSPQSPTDPTMPPKNQNARALMGATAQKQGDSCQIYQNTHTSLLNRTK